MAGTLVTFHAHPDDECISTGGSIAKAAAEGHRVVLVVATRGEQGEVGEDVLRDGESLTERRVSETMRAAEILGIDRVEFLGYEDSGMIGTPENDAPTSFWSADVDEAAERLAAILRDEGAEVLTIYDEQGGYGHPDHIQVHRVGARAGELAETPRVYEATINRDEVKRFMRERLDGAMAEGVQVPPDFEDPESVTIGVPEDEITTTVDATEHAGAKRAALSAHSSQVDETSWFLAMPEEVFGRVFGVEWFIRRGAPPGLTETSLFPDATATGATSGVRSP
jgi:LmbE family N-acetylglucosaminyl deacetylase